MFRSVLFTFAAVLLLSAPALAGGPTVGDTPPEIHGATWMINAPDYDTLADLKGEVALVTVFNSAQPDDKTIISTLNDWQANSSARGLHLFSFERSGYQTALAQAYMHNLGVKFPASRGGFKYATTETPHAWLIGVDGTVIWEGNLKEQKDVVQYQMNVELAKVTYPGLFRSDISKAAEKAAKLFVKGKFAKARKAAEKLLADEDTTDEESADATYIVERIDALLTERQAAAKSAEEAKRYSKAIEIHTWIANMFRRTEAGDAAKARLKELLKDDAVSAEMAATKAWARLQAGLVRVPPHAWKSTIQKFENGHPDTRAAAEAKAMRESF